MSAAASSLNLVQLIHTLEAQKAEHAAAAAAVAGTLEQIGGLLGSLLGGQRAAIAAPTTKSKPAAKLAAAKPAGKPGRRGRRTKFAKTGEETVLAFIEKEGNPSTSEIQAHWKSEGRSGASDNSISTLMKKKKLKREENKTGRGSRYTIA